MLASGDALTSRDCPAGATFPQLRLGKSVDSSRRDDGQDESHNRADVGADSSGREKIDAPLDGGVGAVIGGFEPAVGAVLRVWPVMEAAVGERPAQTLVEEQEEPPTWTPFGVRR